MRWQVKKRPMGFRPRVQALPSVAATPNERWATDLCRVWAGRDGWAVLALVMDCHTPRVAGLAPVAQWEVAAPREAPSNRRLIARYGTLGRVPRPFLLALG